MGLQFPNLEWSPDFGIKVIILLLIKSEVNPNESIVQKAKKSMGAISSMFFLKNPIGKSL
jgi:hypothetical protein